MLQATRSADALDLITIPRETTLGQLHTAFAVEMQNRRNAEMQNRRNRVTGA